MKSTVTALRMLIRLCGVLLIILGILFWTGNALSLIPVHMLIGVILVLSLWALALIAARAGAPTGPVAAAFIWGLIVPILGATQQSLLPGPAHWIIQVLHLLVGIAAIGMAEGLGRRIREVNNHQSSVVS